MNMLFNVGFLRSLDKSQGGRLLGGGGKIMKMIMKIMYSLIDIDVW